LDGDRINPSSVAALAGASHLTRLALLHSPYLKYASSPLHAAQSLLWVRALTLGWRGRPIPVSEMKLTDKAEESKYPVFEWQLMPALQGCLTPAMTELILHFDSETITEEVVCQIVGLYAVILILSLARARAYVRLRTASCIQLTRTYDQVWVEAEAPGGASPFARGLEVGSATLHVSAQARSLRTSYLTTIATTTAQLRAGSARAGVALTPSLS
jgi:hypothetical protein